MTFRLSCSDCIGNIKDFSDGVEERRIILPDILSELKLIDQEGYLLNKKDPADCKKFLIMKIILVLINKESIV